MQINLPDGSKIDMDLESVKNVMGIRCTGQDIVCSEGKVSESAKLSLCGRFEHGGAEDLPELDDLRRAISYDYGHSMSKHDEDTFMIALSAFVCAYMFGPPRRTAGVPRDIWEFISNPVNLLNCNWGAYVLKVIQSCARTVQMNLSSNPTSIKLGGCWLYLELLYMDAIDLGANNVPLSWYPRVLWYETQLVHNFARCYEKCKGPKAKGAYLNRKRRVPSKDDSRSMPGTIPTHTAQCGHGHEIPGTSHQPDDAVPVSKLEELMSKIQTVHDKVQVQLDVAQQQAHDDNKRNFEEQE